VTELVSAIVQQLGMTEAQAQGGAGQLGNLAALVGGFTKLGLNRDTILKLVPVVIGFVQSKAGPEVGALLQKALKA
jgi:hypothetical protein